MHMGQQVEVVVIRKFLDQHFEPHDKRQLIRLVSPIEVLGFRDDLFPFFLGDNFKSRSAEPL